MANSLLITGRLREKPLLNDVPFGPRACEFGIITAAGEFSVVASGKPAEKAGTYGERHMEVTISGYLAEQRWKTKRGSRSRVVIVAQQIELGSPESPADID